MAKVDDKFISYDLQGKTHPDPPYDDLADWCDFYTTDYVSSSSMSFSGRCGKVKRSPTLAELEGDDMSYESTDDTYYEERK